MHKTGVKRDYPRIYKIWQGMRQRCDNPNDKDYERYGGRGISVCKEWEESSMAFVKWAISNGYAENLSLDRINTNGNYCPANCRWANATQQARNRRIQKSNKTGVSGVHMDRGQFRATIYVKDKRIDLGRHKTFEEAAAARKAGEALYWGVTA